VGRLRNVPWWGWIILFLVGYMVVYVPDTVATIIWDILKIGWAILMGLGHIVVRLLSHVPSK